MLLSEWKERMRVRKKNWFCLKIVSSSPSWLWCRVDWRSPRTICTSTMAAVRKKRQRRVRNVCLWKLHLSVLWLFKGSCLRWVISAPPLSCRNRVWFQTTSVSASRGPFEEIQPATVCAGAFLYWPGSLLHQLQKEGHGYVEHGIKIFVFVPSFHELISKIWNLFYKHKRPISLIYCSKYV